jgi:hypothetical protein
MAQEMKFTVGERVQSAPDSDDITFMKATWVAVIHTIRGANDAGGCYETIGTWVPLKDENGKVAKTWDDHDHAEAPTLRQLWGIHLAKRETGGTHD